MSTKYDLIDYDTDAVLWTGTLTEFMDANDPEDESIAAGVLALENGAPSRSFGGGASPIVVLRVCDKQPSAVPFTDVCVVHEYGLTQRLQSPVRVF